MNLWRMISLLGKQFLDDIQRNGGIVHLSGAAGTGKTLLASIIAAIFSRSGRVEWISTDGKSGFIKHLKRNLAHYEGVTSNITVTRVIGNSEVLQAISSLVNRLDQDTRLVVVDSITRVLDMSRKDPLLWGRTLFEEALPTLASLAISHQVPIIIVSEIRESEGRPEAVHHRKILQWVQWDLVLERTMGLNFSKIMRIDSSDYTQNQIGKLEMDNSGWATFSIEVSPAEV